MAARRLKFKPKPSVANSVRRARDQEDVAGLTQVTDKELPVISQEAPSSGCKEENTELCARTDSTEILNSTNLKTNHVVEDSSNVGGPEIALTFPSPLTTESCKVQDFQNGLSTENSPTLCMEPHEQDTVLLNSVGLTLVNPSLDKAKNSSVAISQDRNIFPLPSKHNLNQKLESTCNSSDITCENVSVNTDQGSDNCAPNSENNNSVVLSSSSTKDSPGDTTCKSDSSKIFSRFGRSRCKPVLNNTSLRKKNEIVENVDSSTSVNNVRTDSVIKSVQSELNKINSLSKETDTKFSELEKSVNSNLKDKNIVASKNSTVDSKLNDITVVENNQSIIQPVVNDFLSTVTVSKPTDLNNINGDTTSIEKPNLIDLNCKSDKTSNENCAELTSSVAKPTTPSKVPVSPHRPTSKILVPKPSPRLTDAASRRISFHGSDSEEEVKKKLSKVKEKPNITQTPKKEKTLKNSKRKRSQGATFTKLGQDTMKELTKKLKDSDGGPDKTKLTMLDLIFYNPKNNPMSVNPNQTSSVRKKEEKIEVSQGVEDMLEEQSVDDVESTGALPVPQLKVGPDGQIMLDPHSLVIETTGMQKNREKLEKSEVVQENGITRYSTYSKRKHKRTDWTPKETLQFYRALSTIGSDFSLMTQLFPKRTRHDLKLKFKREERTNMQLVDKAMTIRSGFDFQTLEEEMKRENEEIERKQREKELAKEAAKKERALRKEQLLARIKTTPPVKRKIKFRDSAFREFRPDELETVCEKKPKRSVGKKRRVRKKIKKIFESDSDQDMLLDSDSDNVSVTSSKVGIRSSSRRYNKRTKKLKECEEINETLKKKLEHENASRIKIEERLAKKFEFELESEDDMYTPNNTNAFMLFGTPKDRPTEEPEEEPVQVEYIEDSNWNIEIQKLPNIEETVMMDSVEEVSELSELGSFGQNDTDTALDLSIPVRANITSDMLKDSHSLLNRHLISESIQIIDQLTSVENTCSSVFTDVKENIENLEDDLSVEESSDSQIRLPSFESVNRSRPSMAYPLRVPYDPRNYEKSASEVVNENLDLKAHEDSNLPNVFIANFYREIDEGETILGD